MKNHILLLVVSFLTITTSAQPDKFAKALMNAPYIAFEEQQINFRESVKPSLSILISADESDYIRDYKNWLKTKYAIEPKKSSGFYSSLGVVLAELSPDSINFHYKTDHDGDAVRLNILLERNGQFYDEKSNAEVISKLKNALGIQVREFYIKYYDEKISNQQKYYESQLNDMEKLMKKKDKLNGEIADHTNGISKTEDSMREINGKTSESEGKIKTLNAQLQQNQKATEQAQKEVEANQKLIGTKEAEYNRLNASGSLNTKEGERVIKDLEKMRSKQAKLQGTLTDANETTTKTENAILKEEQNKTKLLSKLDEQKNTKDKHGYEINDLKRDVENNESAIKDEQLQIDEAKSDLDKLKAGKEKLITS